MGALRVLVNDGTHLVGAVIPLQRKMITLTLTKCQPNAKQCIGQLGRQTKNRRRYYFSGKFSNFSASILKQLKTFIKKIWFELKQVIGYPNIRKYQYVQFLQAYSDEKRSRKCVIKKFFSLKTVDSRILITRFFYKKTILFLLESQFS